MGLSSSKQKTKSVSDSTEKTRPVAPDFIQNPAVDYFGKAGALLGTQPQTFGPSNLQTQAFNGASALGGANSNVTQGADAIRQGISYQPQNVQAGQLSSTDLSPYKDMYERQVVDAFMGDWAHGNELGLNSLRSAATRSNAYGGSRDAVAQGQLIGDNSRTLAGTLAALRSGGFQNALEAAKGDIANKLSADTFNANMGLQGAQFRQGAGESLANLGLSGDANTRANLGLAGDLGAQQRDIAQQGDPAQAQALWLAKMQALLGLTTPTPFIGSDVVGHRTGTDTTTSTPSGMDQIGQALKIIASLQKPSDRRLKRDERFIGEDGHGVRWWRYNYLWDAPEQPPRMGVMADEIEKLIPEAVSYADDGYARVDYALIAAYEQGSV